ncbi:MAG: hypothetical protein AAB459_04505 [Patescibacteria group bacterium]
MLLNAKEVDGEVLPAYNGVNSPIYLKNTGDKIPDHGIKYSDSIIPENPHWPNSEHRNAAEIGMSAVRETLDKANPPNPR